MQCFELFIRDTEKLSAFIKMCEGVEAITDTGLFKVNKRGVYVVGTDFRNMSAIEGRLSLHKKAEPKKPRCIGSSARIEHCLKLQKSIKQKTKLTLDDKSMCYTSKIWLTELTTDLKTILKRKHFVKILGIFDDDCLSDTDEENLNHKKVKLFVKEIIFLNNESAKKETWNKSVKSNSLIREIKSLDHRSRTYYKLSTKQFKKNNIDQFVELKIINSEFGKIITTLSILSGVNAQESKIRIDPFEQNPSDLTRKTITFNVKNDGGIICSIKIHASSTSKHVTLLNLSETNPNKPVELEFFLTYLHQASNFLNNPQEFTKLIIGDKGLMLHTEIKNQCSLVMFTIDTKGMDLKSYC